MFDGLDAEGGGNMGFVGSWTTDQDHILGTFHELAAVPRPDGGLVDLAGSKVEACEVLARAITFQRGEVAVTGPMMRAILAAIRAFKRRHYARDRDPDPT
jgi:hypothetical protein